MARDPQVTERWLLYDGGCGFCARWCEWARARGADAVANFAACASAVELRAEAGIDDEECARAAILIEVRDGRVVRTRRAAAAVNGLLAHLPGWRNVLWRAAGRLYPLPGLRQLEEAAYRWVARNRGRFGRASCAAPTVTPAPGAGEPRAEGRGS
jgi:predicted DCC family thiol-disulfide oxidoreductase YuxK